MDEDKSIIKRTNDMLNEINYDLDLTNELPTEIHPEIFFKRNSVNLLIGKKGSGKTYNVFRELLKLKFVPNHNYTKLIYVTDKAYDPTFERVKDLLLEIMEVDRVPYAEAVEKIREASNAKSTAHMIHEGEASLDDLTEESTEKMLDGLGIDDPEQVLEQDVFHTAVLLDDCQDVFEKRTPQNRELFKLLFENRQPKITYFLTQQDAKGIDSSLRQNLDAVWVFGCFAWNKFNYLMFQVPHEQDAKELWEIYKQITKNQCLIFVIEQTGTELIIVKE